MTNSASPTNTTLVLGGTGKTGRRVAQRLASRGLPVRIGSRSGTPRFEWQDEVTWGPVLSDVAAVYIVYHPDLAFPGAADTIRAFATAAVACGASRLVLLSGRGEEEAEVSERAVQESGADWTILRASWFSQNFSEHFLLEPVLSGVIALPAGDVAEPFVDADDIADVAVAALTADGHSGQRYELTGPRLLTFADVAAEIATAADRDVRYEPVSPDQYAVAAIEAGVPAEEVQPLTELFTRVLDGRNAHVTDGVRRAIGREPRDFSDYARDTARDRLVAGITRAGVTMTDRSLTMLTTLTALGCGVVSGVFFAFSVFVMKALGRLPPANGIAAMQSINTAAPTPWFMAAILGTGVACLGLAGSAMFRMDEPDAIYHGVGGVLYVLVILLTITYHVPRNDALAALDPDSVDAARYWSRYLSEWTAWNHARTILSVAAAGTLTAAFASVERPVSGGASSGFRDGNVAESWPPTA